VLISSHLRDEKRVLVRVDYNVPIKDGVVTDSTRIEASLPTLHHLLTRGQPKCLVLITHLGQPVGSFHRADYSLAPVAQCLARLLPGRTVRFLSQCVGPEVEAEVDKCAPGTIFLLENLRFHLVRVCAFGLMATPCFIQCLCLFICGSIRRSAATAKTTRKKKSKQRLRRLPSFVAN
jgi:3-phosphoglycerate kinase